MLDFFGYNLLYYRLKKKSIQITFAFFLHSKVAVYYYGTCHLGGRVGTLIPFSQKPTATQTLLFFGWLFGFFKINSFSQKK